MTAFTWELSRNRAPLRDTMRILGGQFVRRLIGAKQTRLGLVLSAALLLVVAFQNCSQPPPNDEGDQLASEAEKVDFAYDAVPDQLSYLSCAAAEVGTFDTSAYFSFRVGAYRSGGLKLNDAFRVQQGKKPPEKQASLLTLSPANSSTSMQIAIRQRANFQVMYTSSGAAKNGEDYMSILEPLGTVDLSDILVRLEPSSRVRYLRNGSVYGSRFEGSLFYTKNPTLAGSIRTALKNDAFLALTYSQQPSDAGGGSSSATPTLARGPRDVTEGSTASPYTQAYGKGLYLSFAQPTQGATAAQANYPQNVIREVTEFNLLSSTDRTGTASWSCPDTMKFRVVRPEDVKAGRVVCAIAPDPAIPTADLLIVRNQFRVEDWYVDMTNRCIMPKKSPSTCYGSGVTTVQYAINQTCTEGGNPACVHYASVCYRN